MQRILNIENTVLRLLAGWLAIWMVVAVPSCKVNRLVSDIQTVVDLRMAMEEAGSAKMAWRIARKVDTFESYRNFLILFPNSKNTDEAFRELAPYEKELWQELQWAMNGQERIRDYFLVKYLDFFPEGAHRGEAQTIYDNLPDSARWYTLGFRDLSLAPFIYDRVGVDSFNLHGVRLEGLQRYLARFPEGLLSSLMAERFAHTFLGYRLLPADSTVTPRVVPIDESWKNRQVTGIKSFEEMPETAAGEASGFLHYILNDLAEIPVSDEDNDSILDEPGMPEVRRAARKFLSPAEEESLRTEQRSLLEEREYLRYEQQFLQESLEEFMEEFNFRKEYLPVEPNIRAAEELNRIEKELNTLEEALSGELPLTSQKDLEAARTFLDRSASELEENMLTARTIFEESSVVGEVRDKEDEQLLTDSGPDTPTEETPLPAVRPGRSPAGEEQLTGAMLEARAEESLRSVTSGKFLYDSIPVLTVGKPFLFKLAIVPDTEASGAPDLIDPEGAISRSIPISNEMSVRIVADRSAFNIQPVSDTIQPIDFQRGTLWSWQIIPLKPGKHKVIVSIDILTKSELTGDIRRKSVNVYDEEVEVIVEEREEEPAAGFGIDPLYFLLLLIPLGLLLFWWNRRKKTGSGETEQVFPGETPQEKQFLQENREELLALMEKAESWIAKGDTQRALNELLDFFNNHHEPIHKELITLSARFNKYQREANLGLDPKESVLNRINLALIELMGRVRGSRSISQ